MPENSTNSFEQLLQPPMWMDVTFVEAALRQKTGQEGIKSEMKSEQEATHVEQVNVEPAMAVGDHYLSRIFRIIATVRECSLPVTLIVKCLPEDELMLKWIREKNRFANELHMYRQVMPAMEELLDDGAFTKTRFTARFFPNASDDLVMLEDLTAQGFVMRNPLEGLDHDHAMATLRALGRFHAASAVLLERNPQLFQPLSSIFHSPSSSESIHTSLIRRIMTIMKTWKDFPHDLRGKLEAAAERTYDIATELCSENEGYMVLNHGDLWTNNLMFRQENGEIECLFLDLQFSFVGSPAIDLITLQRMFAEPSTSCWRFLTHFLESLFWKVTSLEPEVWRRRWAELLEEYSSSLAEAARRLGARRVPSAEDVRAELRRARFWTLVTAVTWMPVVFSGTRFNFAALVQKGGATDCGAFTGVSKEYERRLRHLLSYCDEMGIFEDAHE